MINVKDPRVHGLLKIMEGSSEKKLWVGYMIVTRVANTDPFGSGVFFLDPDPVFKFLWIRIRFQPRFWNKKECRKVSKSDLS